ncbi:hypothetical protein M441DRAFT_442595 [Trichoderma asperellum CBS 433.97]|uniref:Uncharacterized protein n=1 Tax=Trichoderma asperellum (strain ATCC 204424 / CBS 433.97 / NBRC 101777) TaxID=1042311 RepID=A0A2T3Z4H1_TRIA4|nr:hypothetical protein M441DRAFT_442595 [Trichoderma asperellum CBS 433.97]PTB39694.1 hypothetical protein M441DRAFT_442595 [Trichoderma asperellum CBS 433.97]
MSRPGDMIKGLPRPLWLLGHEVFDAVFCTSCLGVCLSERICPYFLFLPSCVFCYCSFYCPAVIETSKRARSLHSLALSCTYTRRHNYLSVPRHSKKKKKIHLPSTSYPTIFSTSPLYSTTVVVLRLRLGYLLLFCCVCQFKISHSSQSFQFRHPILIQPVIITLRSKHTAHSIARCLSLAHRHTYLALHSFLCRLKEKIGYHAPISQ